MSLSPRDLVARAMRREPVDRIPVMCQMANGHTVINTGVHPIDYFVDNDVWADCLLSMRALYDFDGILCHKPGRVKGILDLVERADRDAPTPALHLHDGSRIECTRDDDAYYKPGPDFRRPALSELDLDDLLGWAPESFRAFQASKATMDVSRAEDYEDHIFGLLDRIIAKVGAEHSVHGEVRSPFDHFLNILGMEDGLVAILDEPDRCVEVLERLASWSVSLAVAQVRRGADAIKISSPFASSAFLSPEMYEQFILPFEGRIAAAVRAEGGIVYTHTCGAIGDRLELMARAGVHGIECLDPPPLGDVEITEAVAALKGKIFIKGNVDPVNTLLRGDDARIRREVTAILEAAREMDGFILSSACSVAPPTPPDNLKRMVELAREFR